jgi:lipopolysaccharide export system ATP-binding protein
MQEPYQTAMPAPPPAPAGRLEAQGLAKRYGKRWVVQDVGLEVAQGEVVGLLGPNGSGKTTTFHMISGFIPPDVGAVSLDGAPLTELPVFRRARMGIVYLPQESSIFRKLTVEENLLLVLEQLGLPADERHARARGLLEEMGVAGLARQRGDTLSGGERRRVEIARALVLTPRFLLLDEPFAGIDPIAVIDLQRVIQQLRERGIGILITDHNVRETLKITDRAYIINGGRIFRTGSPAALSRDPEVKRVYLGEEFTLT